MNDERKAQAKKIAEKYPNLSWAREGMALRGLDNRQYRYVTHEVFGYRDGEFCKAWADYDQIYHLNTDDQCSKFSHMLGDLGPDLDDPTTVLSLLTLLPLVMGGVMYDPNAGGWRHTYTLENGTQGIGQVCPTMTEAIVGAVLEPRVG